VLLERERRKIRKGLITQIPAPMGRLETETSPITHLSPRVPDLVRMDSPGLLMNNTELRNALFSQRAPDDFTYTDWFYGYQPERKEINDGH
jgi:hypothetical protein